MPNHALKMVSRRCNSVVLHVILMVCYLIKLSLQPDHAKKKNCNNNPNCLFGLGEFTEGIWKKEGEKKLFTVVEEEAANVRVDMEKPAGLANLGSTCYLNSVLQILYHVAPLRHALYSLAQKQCESAVTVQLINVLEQLSSGRLKTVHPVQLIGRLP